MNNTQTLGAIIASYRKVLGMTQLELAEKMGVTDKAVSKWERDLSCPDIAILPKLAELFGISVDDLIQSRTSNTPAKKNREFAEVMSIIFKAVPLAMGVGVIALSAMKQLTVESGLSMLAIGLVCLALNQFQK